MGLTTILFPVPFETTVGGPGEDFSVLVLDVSVREGHSRAAAITAHAVEDGSDVTDHIRPEPEQVMLEGLISNTPLGYLTRIREAGEAAFSAALATGRPLDALAALADPKRAETAYARLQDLLDRPRLVTIATSLRLYEDMALERLDAPRDGGSGDAVRFTAVFRRIRKVASQTVDAPVTEVKQAKAEVDVGRQPTEPASEDEAKKISFSASSVDTARGK